MAGGLQNVKLGCRFTLVVFVLSPVIKLIGIVHLLFYCLEQRSMSLDYFSSQLSKDILHCYTLALSLDAYLHLLHLNLCSIVDTMSLDLYIFPVLQVLYFLLCKTKKWRKVLLEMWFTISGSFVWSRSRPQQSKNVFWKACITSRKAKNEVI